MMNRCHGLACAVVMACVIAAASPAAAQWKLENDDGTSWIKFGVLAQARAESFENADGDGAKKDLYFRRLRLLAGGQIFDKITFFMETDTPNLGYGAADGSKIRNDIYIQDFVVSYNHSMQFKLDGGLILIPTCYNCNSSAASLLPVDYGAFSFLSSGPTTANVGRDYGVQARGNIANDKLEYRIGVFQGNRGDDGENGFRYAGRLMYNFLEPQSGLFYVGNSLGTKKLFSIGASFDSQEEYLTYAFDAFFDHPVGKNSVTLQANVITYDGDTFLTTLPKQTTLLFEAQYYFTSARMGPFLQYLDRDFENDAGADETRWQVGLAWYPKGQNLNLKLGLGQHEKDGSPDRFRAILQCQLFTF